MATTTTHEAIIYQTQDQLILLSVKIEQDTIWLTQKQIAELFGTEIPAISKHIRNIFSSEELQRTSTVSKMEIVQQEGKRMILREIDFYNLDIVIAVGYRVNSKRATEFRIWATRVLKDYLLKGYAITQRFERIEEKLYDHDKKFEVFIQKSLPPIQGIFFDGQIFDAHVFVSNLIKSAKDSIVLIDNYIDETVFLLLSKKVSKVSAKIYTKQILPQLQLDVKKYNAQYGQIEIEESNYFHDRFLIIDKMVYHIGASLKDLGKKLFAFTKMELDTTELLLSHLKK
jgi:hypothetical protein